MPGRRQALRQAKGLAALWLIPSMAQGQPLDRPIRLIVPYQPGGGVDVVARIVAQALARNAGQPVLVDNRPGGNGVVGALAAANAVPDGHTLLLDAPSVAMNPALMRQPPYDPRADLQPVARVANVPCTISVHPSLPVSSFADLVRLSRARPDTLNLAFGGAATNLVAELLRLRTGLRVTFVPYRGSAASSVAVIANEAQLLVGDLPSVAAHAAAGTLRILALTTAERSSLMPGVPTVAESGSPGTVVEFWDGVFAPRGTPSVIVERLNGLLMKAISDPSTQEQMSRVGATPALLNTPGDFAAFFLGEVRRWHEVVERAAIERN